MKMTFNPTLSFDGVAIITACIGCALWFGTLSATVKQHTEQLQQHDRMLQTMAGTENAMAQNIAVLQTLVKERTDRDLKSKGP